MVVELVKAIKPQKLAVDKVRLNILNELRKEGTIVRRELNKTVRTWRSKPQFKFETLIGLTREDAIIIVGPSGSEEAVLKWIWADEGTRPHVIRAKNAPLLRFRSGFSPKTLPNRLASFPGSRSGPWVSKQSVNHPGTEPRNFSKLIVRRRQKKFAANLIKAARI